MSAVTEVFLPFEVQSKMNMVAKDPHACKISMLWNWYTIDSCFIAKSWHVTSRGMFAGTCVGLFFWILAYCWFHRFIVEFDNAIVDYKVKKHNVTSCGDCCGENAPCAEAMSSEQETEKSSQEGNAHGTTNTVTLATSGVKAPGSDLWSPLLSTFSHKWYIAWLQKNKGEIYPSPAEHIARSGLYLMEWTCSYLIMLMWMYYNGYLIITMILGYFFGQLLFNYTPLAVVDTRPAPRDYTTPGCA